MSRGAGYWNFLIFVAPTQHCLSGMILANTFFGHFLHHICTFACYSFTMNMKILLDRKKKGNIHGHKLTFKKNKGWISSDPTRKLNSSSKMVKMQKIPMTLWSYLWLCTWKLTESNIQSFFSQHSITNTSDSLSFSITLQIFQIHSAPMFYSVHSIHIFSFQVSNQTKSNQLICKCLLLQFEFCAMRELKTK